MSTGRNFDEILRVLDSIQLTSRQKVSTPANWKQGDDIILSGAVSNEEADKLFPGYKTIKPYLADRSSTELEACSPDSVMPRMVESGGLTKSTGGEVANALVCKTSIRGFDSRPVLHTLQSSQTPNSHCLAQLSTLA